MLWMIERYRLHTDYHGEPAADVKALARIIHDCSRRNRLDGASRETSRPKDFTLQASSFRFEMNLKR
jgi:hypothetical protein